MRQWWMVLRYKDTSLVPNPEGDGRTGFLLYNTEGRGFANLPIFTNQGIAEQAAARMAEQYPTDSIILLNQLAVFEIPSLPRPIKKVFNSKNELVPDA